MGCCIPKPSVTQPSRPSSSRHNNYGTLVNSQEVSQPSTPGPSRASPSAPAPSSEPRVKLDITYSVNRKGTRKESTLSKKSTLTRGSDMIRVATWNLLTFSQTKASDPRVLEVVVDIILNNGLDLIAVQELSDQTGIKLVCSQLNKRSGNDWRFVVSNRAGRMYKSSEYLGFLWNASKGLQHKSNRLLTGNNNFARSPYLANFKINNQKLLLVNVHLKAVGLAREDVNRTRDEVDLLSLLIKTIYILTDNTSVHTFLLGDFNLSPDSDFDRFYSSGFQNLLPKDTHTNISARNPRGSMSYDNIWVSLETLQTVYGGRCCVIREGLVDVHIRREDRMPTVSDHCPVWADFNL